MVSSRLPRSARWRWHRMERRAIVAHDRQMLAAVRSLGASVTPVLAVETGQRHVALSLPRHRLLLVGIAPTAVAALAAHGDKSLVLHGGGRYGPFWWILVTNGAESWTVLGSHLRLAPAPGGQGPRGASPPDGAGLAAAPA